MLQGCLYFYHDEDKTVLCTVLKDVDADTIKADPNRIEMSRYSSESKEMFLVTPWGIIEVKK